MSHFIPKIQQKYSDGDIFMPSYSNLSLKESVAIGLYQSTMATYDGTQEIVKNSEKQFAESMKMNENSLKIQIENAEQQLNETKILNDNLLSGLSDINYAISQISDNFDIKVSALIEQQILSNTKIDNLIDLIRIPEFEKERIYYFSEGMRFLKQVNTSKKRYIDVLKNFLRAYEINSSDYLLGHQIGLIYLYNEDYIDLPKAEEFLINSADYGSSNRDKFSALTYQHLAYCQLLQFKIPEALENARLGYKLDSSISELKIIELECLYILEDFNNLYDSISKFCKNNISNCQKIRNSEILNKGYNVIELIVKIEKEFINRNVDTLIDKLIKYKPYFDVFFNTYSPTTDNDNVYNIIGYDKRNDITNSNELYEYFNDLAKTNNISEKNNLFSILEKTVLLAEDNLLCVSEDINEGIELYKETLKYN